MEIRGYTIRIVKANAAADQSGLGVRLGKFCINKDIPVSHVAEFFGVSRMTIYKWFAGEWIPRKKHTAKIMEIMRKAKR